MDHNHGSSSNKSDGTHHQLRRRIGQVGPEDDVTSDTIISTTSDGTSLTANSYSIDNNVLLDSTSSIDGIAKKAGEDLVKADGDGNNDDNKEEEDDALVGPPSYGNDFNVIFANDDNKEEDDAIVGVAPVEVELVAGTDAKVSEFCFV